jgi:hypothetical protein
VCHSLLITTVKGEMDDLVRLAKVAKYGRKSVRTTILRDFSGIVEVGHLDRQGIVGEGLDSEARLGRCRSYKLHRLIVRFILIGTSCQAFVTAVTVLVQGTNMQLSWEQQWLSNRVV